MKLQPLLENDTTMYIDAIMILVDHYLESSNEFMAVALLLQFVTVTSFLIKHCNFDSPSKKATWYHYCIRSMERCMQIYPNHKQINDWQQKTDELRKMKKRCDEAIYLAEESDEDEDEIYIRKDEFINNMASIKNKTRQLYEAKRINGSELEQKKLF